MNNLTPWDYNIAIDGKIRLIEVTNCDNMATMVYKRAFGSVNEIVYNKSEPINHKSLE